jgi:hypothetical protein
MGRRSRARERTAASAVAEDPGAAPRSRTGRRRGWLRALNPFKFRQLTRSRARTGAIGFGLLAVLFAVLGMVTKGGVLVQLGRAAGHPGRGLGGHGGLLGRDDPSS